MKTGIELIAAERQEQIEKHGYTKEHDEQVHFDGALITAALYALTVDAKFEQDGFEGFEQKIRGKNYDERLIITGALIAAEIDRLQTIL